MRLALAAALVFLANTCGEAQTKLSSDDWPWWRGPAFNGIAKTAPVPQEWSETKNILWKSPIPGRGHSSPVIVGWRVFLSTADEKKNLLAVLCYDRASGKEQWRRDVLEGSPEGRVHGKNTRASSTVACDGERVYAIFHKGPEIWATALDLDGKQLWQKKVGGFVSHWGYSASPTIYRSSLIVATDHKDGGGIHALDLKSGDLLWETPRPKAPTYASPVVLKVAGKDQLLIAGGDQVCSYDAASGKEIWSVKGTSVECVSTILADGDRVFATGGYPEKETLCIRADETAKVLWRVKVGDFVPSQLLHKGFIYSVLDNGVTVCLNAANGEEMWRDRLTSPAFSASPVLVGDNIYIPSETGVTHVFRANPKKLEVIAENQLGKQAFASPAVAGAQLFLRVVGEGRQETLYCIGAKKE